MVLQKLKITEEVENKALKGIVTRGTLPNRINWTDCGGDCDWAETYCDPD